MAITSVPNLGPDPFTVNASVLNGKVDPLVTDYNGNIDNDNIAASAAIANSKLNLASIAQNVTLAGTNVLSGATTISGALTVSGVATMSSKILKFAKGADVASTAGTITLGDDGNAFDITGTAAITGITAKAAGTMVSLQFDSTASLVDGSNLKIAGNFQGAAESTITLVSDGTNWFEVARSPSAYTPTAANALVGSVVQVVSTQTGAVATGSTALPNDDSIPQNNEGDEYMTLAITPTSASNKLLIQVVACYAPSAPASSGVCLFQDSTANALAAEIVYLTASNANYAIPLNHFMTSGTTSATTFKVRIGLDAGTVTFNGFLGARKFGGVIASSITIWEIKV